MNETLKIWGTWKRYYIIGIGFSSTTIEARIMSGEIMGDGNKGGAKGRGGARFIENPFAEKVDAAVKRLEGKHCNEMRVVKARYITQWSVKKIAKEMGISKYQCKHLLGRAETLIEGAMN